MLEYYTINRDNQLYIDIENYKDYELTQCLVYEIVIRTDKVVTLLQEMNDVFKSAYAVFFKYNKNNSYPSTYKEQKTLKLKAPSSYSIKKSKYHRENNLFHISNEKTVYKTKISPTLQYQIYESIKYKTQRYIEIQQEIEEKYFYTLTHDDLLENRHIEHKERLMYKEFVTKIIQYDEVYMDDELLRQHRRNRLGSIYIGTLKVDPIKLYPPFSQIPPSIPLEKSKKTNVSLNLALPKKELLDYISQMKDNYDRDHSSINLPLEEIIRESDINTFYNNRSKIAASGYNKKYYYPPKTQQQIYADIFFIYDYLKNNHINQSEKYDHCISSLYYYYWDIVVDANATTKKQADNIRSTLSDSIAKIKKDRVKELYQKLISYIDTEKYKELIT